MFAQASYVISLELQCCNWSVFQCDIWMWPHRFWTPVHVWFCSKCSAEASSQRSMAVSAPAKRQVCLSEWNKMIYCFILINQVYSVLLFLFCILYDRQTSIMQLLLKERAEPLKYTKHQFYYSKIEINMSAGSSGKTNVFVQAFSPI